MIKKNENSGKWEGYVDGALVSTCSTKEKVESFITRKYGKQALVQNKEDAAAVSSKVEFTVDERFSFLAQFTRLAARGIIPGLVITGSGGLGKTHTVVETLKSMGLKEDTIGTIDGDFVFVKGYTTPRNLYTTLYHNNGKVIVFDDCDSSFRDPIGSNIFKAALDSYDRRIITWGAESKDDEVPSRFEFNGRVIFISNLEMGKFPQAIISRSMLTDLTLTLSEKLIRIEDVFMSETNYDADDKNEVIKFIRDNATRFRDLNIRSAFNTLKMKLALGSGWERAALYSATIN